MKKLIIAIVAILAVCASADAQNIKDIGSRLKRHAEWQVQSSVESSVNRKVDDAVGKAIDKAEEKARNKKAEKDAQWKCPSCGKKNTGNFCVNCGAQKPLPKVEGWTCTKCGTSGNKGKFCANCGNAQPGADGTGTAAEGTTEGAAASTAASGTWRCPECDYAGNTGSTCNECGAAKPKK